MPKASTNRFSVLAVTRRPVSARETRSFRLRGTDDRAAGAGFAAVQGDVAMVHAVEVLPAFRRQGVAGWMMRQAALWAADRGALRIGLAVSRDNAAARATWDRLGFVEAAGYAYYARPL